MISKINNLAWKSISWLERMIVRLMRRRELSIVVQPAERSGRNKTDSVWRRSFIPARRGGDQPQVTIITHHSVVLRTSISLDQVQVYFSQSVSQST